MIAWKTQKQHYVSLSTCQAEYIAMSEARKEMIALSFSLEGLVDENLYPMTLKCDNSAAIACTQIQGCVLRFHYIKECEKRVRVVVKWVNSKNHLADIFTKPLSFMLHEELTNKIFNII